MRTSAGPSSPPQGPPTDGSVPPPPPPFPVLPYVPGAPLSGERVLLCATGSVAALRVPALAAAIAAAGADVRVAATAAALHFLTREAALPLGTQLLTDAAEWAAWTELGDPVGHIEAARWATVMVLAPASANSLAKVAAGAADNLVTCAVLAWSGGARRGGVGRRPHPAVVAPAMNTAMWAAEAVAANVAILRRRGWRVVPPVAKRLACGDVGVGAMASPEAIVDSVVDAVVAARREGGADAAAADAAAAAPAAADVPATAAAAIPTEVPNGSPDRFSALPPGVPAATAARVASVAAAGLAVAVAGVDESVVPASRVVWVVDRHGVLGEAALAFAKWLAAAPELGGVDSLWGRAASSPLPMLSASGRTRPGVGGGDGGGGGTVAAAAAAIAARGGPPLVLLLHSVDAAAAAAGPPVEVAHLVGAPRTVTLVVASVSPAAVPSPCMAAANDGSGKPWPVPDVVAHVPPPVASATAVGLVRDAAAALATAGVLVAGGDGSSGGSDGGDGGGGGNVADGDDAAAADRNGGPHGSRATAAEAAVATATAGWSPWVARRLPLAALAAVPHGRPPSVDDYWEAAAAAATAAGPEGDVGGAVPPHA